MWFSYIRPNTLPLRNQEYHHDYRAFSTKRRVNKMCMDVYEEKVEFSSWPEVRSRKFSGNWGWWRWNRSGLGTGLFNEAAINSNRSINQTWSDFNWSRPVRKWSILFLSFYPHPCPHFRHPLQLFSPREMDGLTVTS